MAVIIRSLADGPVPSPNTNNLYPSSGGVAAGKAVIVKNMRFVNKGTSPATLNVYFSGASQRQILPLDLQLPPGFALVDDQELTLEAGDKIEGKASTANVDFVISGVERDVL